MKYGKNAHESYNAQVISNNGIIVAATVSTSENGRSRSSMTFATPCPPGK
ncbi:MAG: hypothetical protein OEV66_12315 [Spirochaetia bacterium]|nr:hypothetical protein [Spirochaetia bacterium]